MEHAEDRCLSIDLLPECIRKRITVNPETGCWLWTGSDSGTGRGGGYGRVSWKGHTWAVHRLVYRLIRGRWLPNKQLDHECEVRLCCNPDHLQPVTNLRNQRLRASRRRSKTKLECTATL